MNQLSGTCITLYKLFQGQKIMLRFLRNSTCRPSLVHMRDFSCPDSWSGGFKTSRRWVTSNSWSILKNFGTFSTTHHYSLKEALKVFLIFKTSSANLKTFETRIFRMKKKQAKIQCKNTMQKNICKLVEGKWVKIQRFWLTLIKNGLTNKKLKTETSIDFKIKYNMSHTSVIN